MGSRDTRRLTWMGGRVPHSPLAASLSETSEQHVRIHDHARHCTNERAPELACVAKDPTRRRIAVRRALESHGARFPEKAGADAVRNYQKRQRENRGWVRSRAAAVTRR